MIDYKTFLKVMDLGAIDLHQMKEEREVSNYINYLFNDKFFFSSLYNNLIQLADKGCKKEDISEWANEIMVKIKKWNKE